MNMKNEALWRIWKHILNSPQVCKSCAKYFDLRNRFWKHEKLMHRTRTRRTFSKHVLHEDQKERGFRNMKDSFLKSWCNFVELSYENKSVSSRLQTHLLQNLKTSLSFYLECRCFHEFHEFHDFMLKLDFYDLSTLLDGA